MSKRNRRDAKKMRKLERVLTRSPQPLIDLEHYLQLHGYAQTAGGARQIILDGRVQVDGEPIGIGKDKRYIPDIESGGILVDEYDVVHLVPDVAGLRASIVIAEKSPEEVDIATNTVKDAISTFVSKQSDDVA